MAAALNQPEPFAGEENDENQAEALRSDTMSERIKESVAGPGDGDRKPNPKKSGDRSDEIKSGSSKREVLGQDEKPDSGIGKSGLRGVDKALRPRMALPSLPLFTYEKGNPAQITISGGVPPESRDQRRVSK